MSSFQPAPADTETAAMLWSLPIQPATRQQGGDGQGSDGGVDQQAGSNSHGSEERSCNGSRRMLLSDLAPAQLLQLIMRCLWTTENLQFARCSRSLMAAADDPFAWATSTLPYFHKLTAFTRLRPLSFKHTRVTVNWSSDKFDVSHQPSAPDSRETARMLQATAALGANFAAFSASGFLMSGDTWYLLLQHPSFQVVRELSFSFTEDPATAEASKFALLSKLQSLTALRLSEYRSASGVGGEDAWSLLCEIPNLRSLSIVDAQCGPHASRLSFAGRCPQLRKLECTNPRIYGAGMFSKALSTLHRIEHLVLSRMWMQGRPEGMQTAANGLGQVVSTGTPPTAEDMNRAFTAMDALTTLELESCEGLDALLPSLVHAPALRQVIIQPSSFSSAPESSLVCCSPEVTATLLAACPRLSLSIHFREQKMWTHWDRIFQDARVLDAARAEGRFETIDKCLRFGSSGGFGTAPAATTPASSTPSLIGSKPAASSFHFSSATATISSSSALYMSGIGFGFGGWSAAGSTSSSSSAWSSATAATGSSASSNLFGGISPANWSLSFSAPSSGSSSSSAAWGSTAAGSSSSSLVGAAPARGLFSATSSGGFDWGSASTGGLFGSTSTATGADGHSAQPFSFSLNAGTSTQSSGSSWTDSGTGPAFSLSGSGWGANNAGSSASTANSQSVAAPAIPAFGSGGLFGSSTGSCVGQSAGPFSFTSGSSPSFTQPSSSSCTSSSGSAFSFSEFGASAGAAAHSLPTAFAPGSDAPAAFDVPGPADNLDVDDREDEL